HQQTLWDPVPRPSVAWRVVGCVWRRLSWASPGHLLLLLGIFCWAIYAIYLLLSSAGPQPRGHQFAACSLPVSSRVTLRETLPPTPCRRLYRVAYVRLLGPVDRAEGGGECLGVSVRLPSRGGEREIHQKKKKRTPGHDSR